MGTPHPAARPVALPLRDFAGSSRAELSELSVPPQIHFAWHPVDAMFSLKLRRSPRAGVVFVRVFLLLR